MVSQVADIIFVRECNTEGKCVVRFPLRGACGCCTPAVMVSGGRDKNRLLSLLCLHAVMQELSHQKMFLLEEGLTICCHWAPSSAIHCTNSKSNSGVISLIPETDRMHHTIQCLWPFYSTQQYTSQAPVQRREDLVCKQRWRSRHFSDECQWVGLDSSMQLGIQARWSERAKKQ